VILAILIARLTLFYVLFLANIGFVRTWFNALMIRFDVQCCKSSKSGAK